MATSNLKVLFIAPIPILADRGGSIRIYEEMKALEKEGVDICCVTYHLGRDVPEMRFDRIPNLWFYKQMDPGGSYKRLLVDLILFIKCVLASFRFRPDLFHGHLHDGGLLAICLGWLFHRPAILDAQGSLTGEMIDKDFVKYDSMAYKIFRKIESFINRKASRIIVSSLKLKEHMENEFGIREVKYIPDGVNIELFSQRRDSGEIIREFNLEDKIVVIYTGILSQFQGVDLLIQSIPFAVKQVKNLCYLIVGYPRIEYYKDMARQLGVAGYIRFSGKISYFEIPKFLGVSHIAISLKSASSTEANLKLFTYMASGLPSLVIDSKENRAVLKDTARYTSLLPWEIAREVTWLAVHREQAVAMGKKACELARESYGWNNTIKSLIEIYNEMQ